MKKLRKANRWIRRNSGTFSALTVMLACLVLLPVGLFTFEIGRVNLAQKELKASTDASALAGAIAISKDASHDDAVALAAAKQAGLMYLQRNSVVGTLLNNSTESATVDTDVPETGKGKFDLLYDKTTGLVTAKAVYGFKPSFGQFLNLPPLPVHGTSKATAAFGGPVDVVVVFDNSDSMDGKVSQAADYTADLIKTFLPPNTHMSLITFNNRAHVIYHLSSTVDHIAESEAHMRGVNDTTNGTRTVEAIDQAIVELESAQHRPEADKVIVLVTDGMAHRIRGSAEPGKNIPLARAQAIEAAATAGTKGITIYGVGFFHENSGDDYEEGYTFMQEIQDAAGGKSDTYMAHSLGELKTALGKVKIGGASNVALVN